MTLMRWIGIIAAATLVYNTGGCIIKRERQLAAQEAYCYAHDGVWFTPRDMHICIRRGAVIEYRKEE